MQKELLIHFHNLLNLTILRSFQTLHSRYPGRPEILQGFRKIINKYQNADSEELEMAPENYKKNYQKLPKITADLFTNNVLETQFHFENISEERIEYCNEKLLLVKSSSKIFDIPFPM